ncbi:DHA2 family efflux MFS transporter permease subunit [Thermomicrobiaceae bacterium CFH 74404]|uniref:DHA2 family efflux MFS transporter permease subunit n=1 Tax=Thermalbibacter longus TaxID=2951981 RepID=A0AA41WFE9_9BACT|nr:DHA2 family efflux MFS transporter permease subunit [Thermalbibacter longus]MCM8748416.1 DHA2 family efflux MFS transporter permease subunit [Thermalbibacter longus]
MSESNPGTGRWFGLGFLAVGLAMIIVDATIVNVAVPSIIADLQIAATDAEWINTVYSLVFAALLISVGRIGDLIGRKRVYLGGLVLFVLASLLCGAVPSGGWLIAARALQGIGAALILPSTLSSVNAMFRGRERGIAFGIWGSVIGGMAALGPLVGGWLTTSYSWHWAFYVNLPIGVVAFAGTALLVPETRDPAAQRGLDPLGIALSSTGFAALVFGLIEGERYGWLRPAMPFRIGDWSWPLSSLSPVPVALGLAALLIPLFFAHQRWRGDRGRPVLVDLALFRYRSFRWGNLTALIVSLGEFGMVFVLPLFLQAVLGYSAFETGIVLLALAAGAFIAGPAAAGLAQRFGPRRVVTAGMALEAVGLLGLAALLSPETSGIRLAPALLVYGVGVGLATRQLTSVILAEVPATRSGQASGIQSTTRQIGSALGIAILGTLLAAGLATSTRDRLEGIPGIPQAQVIEISQLVKRTAGQVLPELRRQPGSEPVVEAIEEAFTWAARRDAVVAAGFILVGFAASWLLPDVSGLQRQAGAAETVETAVGRPSS